MIFESVKDLEKLRATYIDVIDNTPDFSKNTKWIYGKHPTDELIQGYIDNNQMFAILDDDKSILAVVAITLYQEGDYENVPWKTNLKSDEVAVLHILAVTSKNQGKGLSKRLLDYSIDFAKSKGMKAIRLDTLCINLRAQHIYESYGFTYCGKLNLFTSNAGYIDFLFYELKI